MLCEQGVRNEGVSAYFCLRRKEPIREIVIREISASKAISGLVLSTDSKPTRWHSIR